MAACDQRNGLFVVHGHAAKRFADVTAGPDRVGVAVRAFGVDVDEAHLHGAERRFELAVTAVPLVVEPHVLGAPVDVFFGCPDVFTTAGEPEGLESHGLHCDVAGEEHQVGP